MIRTFKHKGLEAFFKTGSKAGIRPSHASRLRSQLTRLDVCSEIQDMNVAGWRFHALSGGLADHCSVTVSGNWRLTFKFENGDAFLVNYQDYH
ncbi:type II toxin-antitoxin system RelE/ParE family toxin [Duganella aceris]|uniref:Peptidase n=1 Tax=Duganella aceris TaxID=2703883 RepID=A0ABX0FMB2_9BURK|nr:type II toxin-antitoxin system RelE/ParE family toxin [Duganella aceris]NGZ85701.1 peptidase [Duganella aceris]